jgi:hypothetical protein
MPSLLLKIEGGGEIVLALNLRKTNFFFTIVWKHIAKGML